MSGILADQLEIWGIESQCVIYKDGSLGFVLKLVPTDPQCWSTNKINGFSQQLVSFLNGLPLGLNVQIIQDIKAGNESLLETFSQLNTQSSGKLNAVGQERVNKYKQLDQLGMLAKYTNYIVCRVPNHKELVKMPSIFSKKNDFQEIFSEALDLRISKCLRIRDDLLATLKSLGITASALSDKEIIEEIYTQWNPARDVKLEFYNPTDLRNSVLFTDAVVNSRGFTLADYHYRVLSLKNMPGSTYSCMASLLQHLPFDSRVQLTFSVPDQQKEIESLQMQRRLAFSMVYGKTSGVSDIESEAKLQDLEGLISELIASGEKVFPFSLNVILRSKNKLQLDDQVSQTLLKFRELGGSEAMEETLAAFDIFSQLSFPHARCKERIRRIKSSNLSDLLPLYGPWMGHSLPRSIFQSRSGSIVAFDPFSSELTNANQIVSGGSGSGKSFLTNLMLLQMQKFNPKIFIIDIGGSYQKICENLEGQYISLGLNNSLSINPFDLPKNKTQPDNQKIKFLLALVEAMTKEQNEVGLRKLERTEVEEAIREVYNKNSTPTLSNLRDLLISHVNPEIQRVGKILNMWCGNTPYGSFLDRSSNINLNRDLVCFDLKGLESYPDLQSVTLLIITDLVWRVVQQDRGVMKFLVFDECWKLLESESGSIFIAEVFRTFRKYFASCIAISQNIDDFAKSKISSAIMSNSSIKWILSQKGADKSRLKDVLELNDNEVDLISSLTQSRGEYSEAFLIAGDDRTVVAVDSTPIEYWLSTTDPRDLSKITELKQQFPKSSQWELLKELSIKFPKGVSQ